MNISSYVALAKPRMVLANVLVAAAAFVFAAPAAFNWQLFALTIGGLASVIAGSCVYNNCYDREIDARMERTKDRAIQLSAVGLQPALLFAAALLSIGIVTLLHVNMLALWAALLGAVSYVMLYTPLKHRTGYALYVGAIAGAVPPVVGYVAVTNALDTTAILLFIALYLWQLPHFVAIAMYRHDEYATAGVPLLVGRPSDSRARAARMVFYASLVVLLLFCAALILHRWMM